MQISKKIQFLITVFLTDSLTREKAFKLPAWLDESEINKEYLRLTALKTSFNVKSYEEGSLQIEILAKSKNVYLPEYPVLK